MSSIKLRNRYSTIFCNISDLNDIFIFAVAYILETLLTRIVSLSSYSIFSETLVTLLHTFILLPKTPKPHVSNSIIFNNIV